MSRKALGGRYTPLLRDPSDPDGGWIVWDSHRGRAVRGLRGTRVFRGRRAFEHADNRAAKLNGEA
jgi:hypothetical protein